MRYFKIYACSFLLKRIGSLKKYIKVMLRVSPNELPKTLFSGARSATSLIPQR